MHHFGTKAGTTRDSKIGGRKLTYGLDETFWHSVERVECEADEGGCSIVVEERQQPGGFVPGGGSDGVLRLTVLLAVQLEAVPLLCLRHRPMVKNGVE
jgi:hypothetical protein